MMREMLCSALGAFGGTVGFAYLFGAPRRTILPISMTALAGYSVYFVLARFAGMGLLASYFLATAVIAVLCEIEARVIRMPSTVFLLCALVALVPGYDLYSAMLALVENDGMGAASAMMRAVQIIAAIAVGAASASVGVRAVTGHHRVGK